MTHVVVVFLDGVGLGDDDPQVNPLAAARLPVLTGVLGGRRLVASSGRIDAPARRWSRRTLGWACLAGRRAPRARLRC